MLLHESIAHRAVQVQVQLDTDEHSIVYGMPATSTEGHLQSIVAVASNGWQHSTHTNSTENSMHNPRPNVVHMNISHAHRTSLYNIICPRFSLLRRPREKGGRLSLEFEATLDNITTANRTACHKKSKNNKN